MFPWGVLIDTVMQAACIQMGEESLLGIPQKC